MGFHAKARPGASFDAGQIPADAGRHTVAMANRFPSEYRETLERLIEQMSEEARLQGLQAPVDYAALRARLREADFGLCRRCGAVLSLARLVRNLSVTLCQQCEDARR
ncbi:MAG TPA: hypothetical protein VHL85_02360 [Burkholderiales bacterium]|jgi:RNA polymerase-binding transcription factor DksA|nr:hypothetical protein [Burkholderiales bacterium]